MFWHLCVCGPTFGAMLAADAEPHYALLGHTASYLLKRTSILLRIERYRPAARYHLVLTSALEARRTQDSVAAGSTLLPRARTQTHSVDALPAWATGLHANMSKRASGPGAIPCWKLFAAYLPALSSIDRLIFLDSDLLLMEDPAPLWAHFDDFAPSHLLGLAMNHDGITGFNSGVLLMQLDRMRTDQQWARLLHRGVAALVARPPAVRLGWLADQTFLSMMGGWQFEKNRLFDFRAAPLVEHVWILPCGWNRQLSVHASNWPNFWPTWATCTEPCRFAHFSGVFFKNLYATLEAERNLTRASCSRVLDRHMRLPGNSGEDKNRMLTYVRQQCCPRLGGEDSAADGGTEAAVPLHNAFRGSYRARAAGPKRTRATASSPLAFKPFGK